MDWYFVVNGERRGPVTEEIFQQNVASGTIAPGTLVWNDTMDEWRPWSEIAPANANPAAEQPLEMGEGRCAHCRQVFPQYDLIEIGGRDTCANCKPIAVQSLQEGAVMPGQLDYAGFWIRVGAKLIDTVILWVAAALLQIPLMAMTFLMPDQQELLMVVNVLSSIVNVLFGVTYTTWFLGRFGATPGKMACGLKVVTAEGEPIGYMRALGRYFAEILSGCLFAIGYIIVAFDDEKRALHDHICSTRVVRK